MFELQEKGRMICLHLNSSEQVVFLLVDSEMVAHFVWNHKCEYFWLVMDDSETFGVSELLEQVSIIEFEVNEASLDLKVHFQEHI